MPRKTRIHYTDEMKSYIWDRYKARWLSLIFSSRRASF